MASSSGSAPPLEQQVASTRPSSAASSFTSPQQPPPWVHFAAGGMGGACGAVVTAPFDLVKTRLQSSLFREAEAVAKGKGRGVVGRGRIGRLLYNFVETGNILKDVYHNEGPRALFRGLGPTLVGVVPSRSTNFFTYGTLKPLLSSYFHISPDSPAIHLGSAASAGVVTATVTNPIWLIKTRIQLQQQQAPAAVVISRAEGRVPPKACGVPSQHFAPSFRSLSTVVPGQGQGVFVRPFSSSWECVLYIWKHEGVAGFYKGLSASYLGVAEGTIQWALYERGKIWARQNNGEESWAGKMAAAGGAKLVATCITYPHEVVRTRMRQAQPPPPVKPKYTGLFQTIRIILAEEGIAAFYSGLSPHLLRVVPNAIVMYTVYETALSLAWRRQAQRN